MGLVAHGSEKIFKVMNITFNCKFLHVTVVSG